MVRASLKKGLKNPSEAYQYLSRYYNPVNLAETVMSVGLNSRFPVGTHVLEKEWDVLVILDTCRVDAMEVVGEEYDFVRDVGRIWSRGGSSPEWIAHTFDNEYREILKNTAVLSANPKMEVVLEDRVYKPEKHTIHHKRFFRYGDWNLVKPSDLARYESLWKYDPQDENIESDLMSKQTLPRIVTDRCIDVMRNEDHDRVILHYMQPHYPYISNAINEQRSLYEYEVRPEAIKTAGREKVFKAYLDHLRYVMDDIRILLNNINADKVAITADHGDAFGEFHMYGHDPGRVHPQVRYVPWVETTATDTGEYTPHIDPLEDESRSTEEQLRALGYK